MKKYISGIILEAVKGDITLQSDITAIVNAANANLTTGGGVAGAIHKAAGPGLYEECRPLAPISPGQAVLTGAYDLPNRFVVHCLGPVYNVNKPEEKYLEDCYKNALHIAEENEIDSIAFPAISTGIFGYPLRNATKTAVNTIIKMLPLKNLKKIRFVLFSDKDLEVYKNILGPL